MNLTRIACVALLVLRLPTALYAQSINPLDDADVLWDFKDLNDRHGVYNLKRSENDGTPDIIADKSNNARSTGSDGLYYQFYRKAWFSFNEKQPLFSAAEGTLLIRCFPEKSGGIIHTQKLSVVIHESGLLIVVVAIRDEQGTMYREIPFDFISLNAWHNIALRFSSGYIDLVVDGLSKGRVALHGSLQSIPTGNSFIGKWKIDLMPLKDFPEDVVNMLFEKKFKGRIDHIAIWNRSLSDQRIAQLCDADKIFETGVASTAQRAIGAYRDFHYASRTKNIMETEILGMTMRQFMAADTRRPSYHLTAPMDAILDPAAAYYYKGKYHVFSYRNMVSLLAATPLAHYVSDDLIHWKDYPIGVWADSDMDVYGIWLGNMLIDDNGVPNMLYTALGKKGKFGTLSKSRDSLLSFTDKETVITSMEHHDGHAWKEPDGWYSLTTKQYWGKRTDGKGDAIMLLKSNDLKDWTVVGELFNTRKDPAGADGSQQNGFTEYPYLLPFGNKYVLMSGTRPSRYWIGTYDKTIPAFVPDDPAGKLVDHLNTFHCFNPMTVDDKGPGGSPRRIIEAMHLYASGNVESVPWYGVHTIPRVLTFENNRLMQQPVPEIEKLRAKHHQIKSKTLSKGLTQTKLQGDAIELVATFEPGTAKRIGIMIRTDGQGKNGVRVYYDRQRKVFGVDGNIKRPAMYPELGECDSYLTSDKNITMRIFIDHSLFEVFVNGETFTGVFNGSMEQKDIFLFSEDGTGKANNIEAWDMKSAFDKAQ